MKTSLRPTTLSIVAWSSGEASSLQLSIPASIISLGVRTLPNSSLPHPDARQVRTTRGTNETDFGLGRGLEGHPGAGEGGKAMLPSCTFDSVAVNAFSGELRHEESRGEEALERDMTAGAFYAKGGTRVAKPCRSHLGPGHDVGPGAGRVDARRREEAHFRRSVAGGGRAECNCRVAETARGERPSPSPAQRPSGEAGCGSRRCERSRGAGRLRHGAVALRPGRRAHGDPLLSVACRCGFAGPRAAAAERLGPSSGGKDGGTLPPEVRHPGEEQVRGTVGGQGRDAGGLRR